ncbi:hypothetical protein ILUMI_00958 [Ignelater luminosus]|uniref:Reverse transcriptase domain-containing protein n=1 Tax=Ignelater luminosus TaxID=2038154 RepID=A0A8K0GM60_IGNLU|nr:hypothetical protein ILUMI_00958 [Ignelater luminosus]
MEVCDDVGNYFRPHQVGFAAQRGCETAIHAVILSLVGVQQGDSAEPVTFSLAIQPIIDEPKSELNVFYPDDGTLSDDPEVVLFNFMNLIDSSQEIGLQVNLSKCELYFCSGEMDTNILVRFQDVAPSIKESLETTTNRLIGLPSHVNLSDENKPAWKFREWRSDLDNQLKNGLESILNIRLDWVQWTQAFLLIKSGGLGIRKVTDVAFSVFLASTSSVHDLSHRDLTLKGFTKSESGAWLQAILSSNIGTLMDNNFFRVCIVLPVTQSVASIIVYVVLRWVLIEGMDYTVVRDQVDSHNELNDILKRSLSSIEMPCSLEPVTTSFTNIVVSIQEDAIIILASRNERKSVISGL